MDWPVEPRSLNHGACSLGKDKYDGTLHNRMQIENSRTSNYTILTFLWGMCDLSTNLNSRLTMQGSLISFLESHTAVNV